MAHKSSDLKLTAVLFFFRCLSYSLTARTFLCSRRSLSRWVVQYLYTGDESSGNHLLYCVPYNPQTSAIENWFSQFKYYLETSKTRSYEERKQDIIDVIQKKITSENYHNYFRYAYDLSSYKKNQPKRSSTRLLPPKRYKT